MIKALLSWPTHFPRSCLHYVPEMRMSSIPHFYSSIKWRLLLSLLSRQALASSNTSYTPTLRNGLLLHHLHRHLYFRDDLERSGYVRNRRIQQHLLRCRAESWAGRSCYLRDRRVQQHILCYCLITTEDAYRSVTLLYISKFVCLLSTLFQICALIY